MEIKAICTKADYRDALREVSALIDLDPGCGSPEGERLEVIGTLVQAYEAKHYPSDRSVDTGDGSTGISPR